MAHDPGTARSLPGAIESGWWMARLFLRVILGRRRVLWLLLLLLVPVGLSVWWRVLEGGSGLALFLDRLVPILLQFFALGLALYLGVAAVHDEIEDRTIVYLFARPVLREIILLGKVLAVVLLVALALGVVALLSYLTLVSADGAAALALNLGALVRALAALALASLAYTGLFALVGVVLPKPMIPALILAFGWEGFASNMPGGFPAATLMFYLKSILGLRPEVSSWIAAFLPASEAAPFSQAVSVPLVAGVVFLCAAALIAGRREFRV